jgi:Fe-S cluster biogenesis protein NfuA
MIDSEIKISAQPLLNPDVCIFQVDRPLLLGGSINCKSKEEASGSPLLEGLFAIEGIREVFIAGDSLTIAKNTQEGWQALGKSIGEVIREQIRSGKPLVAANVEKPALSDEQIYKAVEELLETEINPALGAHGGHVELVEVKDAAVFVRLGGGCQGCGAASMTLKHGIERAIRGKIPAVTDVVDVTDHTAGDNPFY